MTRSKQVATVELLEPRVLFSSTDLLPELISSNEFIASGSSQSSSGTAVAGVRETGSGQFLLNLSLQGADQQDPTTVPLSQTGSARVLSRMNTAEDVDVFKVVATKSGRAPIRYSALQSDGDLNCLVSVWDSDWNVLGRDEAVDGQAGLDPSVLAGATYYIGVAGQPDEMGLYLLRVLPTLTDVFTSATPVAVSLFGTTEVSETLGIGASDMYEFTTPAEGVITIEMAGGGSIDSHLRVFNYKGRLLISNDDASGSTSDARVRLSVRTGRTYYVECSGSNGRSGLYTLTLALARRDDCGNTIAAADTIELDDEGSRWMGGRIDYAQDVDIFRIVATRTGDMEVDMHVRGRRNQLDSRLIAYNSEGEIITSNSYPGSPADLRDSSVTFSVTSGSVYYLAALGESSATGCYLIQIQTQDASPDPTPGDEVIARIVQGSGGPQLHVMGTDSDDAITIRQSSNSATLITGLGSESFSGVFDRFYVYGFGGIDTIRMTYTVIADTWIYGGAGDDMLFEGGSGLGTLFGGLGNDLLVSVGGGSDTLIGNVGLDSFWSDTGDTISDASSGETSAKSVHRIEEFYQPYSDETSDEDYVPLTIAGQDFQDPEITYRASGYSNFASTPLFVDGPQYDDIVQGGVGDCYYLAALASIADTDPGIITQTIAPLGDGTFAVRFYSGGQEVYLRLDADLPVSSGTRLAYAKLGPDDELWVPLMEKAYAYFRYGQNSYSSINGGWMGTVYRQITDLSARYLWTQGAGSENLYDELDEALAEGHSVTVGSISASPSPIAGSHAYMVKSVETTEDAQFVTVYNPWGVDGRSWDSNYSDGLLRISMDQVHECFSAAVVSQA